MNGIIFNGNMNSNLIPDFHIFCAGTEITTYAWLASKCLLESCPLKYRNNVNIYVHIVGQKKREKEQSHDILRDIENITVIEDLIRIDERKTPFDCFRIDIGGGKIRKFAQRVGNRYSLLRPVSRFIAGPDSRGSLGFYHHEWIHRVCENTHSDKPIMFLDPDMFIADAGLFSESLLTLDPKSYIRGWIWRNNNSLTYHGNTYYPMGTELFLINPKLHSALDIQSENMDTSVLPVIKEAYPDAEIENEQFVDTIFQSCWYAAIQGYQLDNNFSTLKACHPGGVGHIKLEYLNNMPSEEKNKIEWIKLNIARIRLHCRVIELVERLGKGDTFSPRFLERIFQFRDFIVKDSQLAEIWNIPEPLIAGEENMAHVEKLFSS